jgi:hypothetical protein
MLDQRNEVRAQVDPILKLAAERSLERTVTDWLELQIQLQTNDGPMVIFMVAARNDAAQALVELAEADPEDPKLIRTLQNRIALFRNAVDLAREVMGNGKMNDEMLRQKTNQDINQYIDPEGRYEAVDLGLITEENNDA